jgi:pyridoxal phosphate enzyme (YggS family)
MSIVENYKLIISKINHLSNKVTLICVTKTFSLDVIKPLVDNGHVHFGENKVQEAKNKWSELLKLNPKINLHMLGKIQSNKIDEIVNIFSFVHSLDNEKNSIKFNESEKKFEKKLNYFIQVNIGNELQKSGIQISLVKDFVKFCKNDLNLNILGLMCIPPFNQNPESFFNMLYKLNKDCDLNNLSMGMSSDYELAIKNGANYIRVGSYIFGNRS